MSTSTETLIGTKFRHAVADANPLWEVTEQIARTDNWLAVCIDEPYTLPGGGTIPSDFAGEERPFSGAMIRRAAKWEGTLNRIVERQDDFWANRIVGEELHYHDSFGRYVRGVVVVLTPENTEARRYGNCDLGDKGLLPTALVGDWSPRDLAYRDTEGRVKYGHHAERIVAGNGAWQPSETCIFEGSHRPRKGEDPRTMRALSLDPPPPSTGETAATEHLVRLRNETARAIEGTYRLDSSPADVRAALRAIADNLIAGLDNDGQGV